MQYYQTPCGAIVAAETKQNETFTPTKFYDTNGYEIAFCPGCGDIVTNWLRTGNFGNLVIDTNILAPIPVIELPTDQQLRRAGMPTLPGLEL